MTLNMGLENYDLYQGCDIKTVGGRLSLITPAEEAADIIGRNVIKIIKQCADRDSITLSGAMAIWAYLIVFHAVVHNFKQVWYDDGRGHAIQIAQH